MHVFEGQLEVAEIHGRNGTFCVGTLRLSIGDFKVKEVALEQFKPGIYNGRFLVEKIFTKGVPWRGGFFTEIIAKIPSDGFLIDEESTGTDSFVGAQQSEPDPVDERPAPAAELPQPSAVPSRQVPTEPAGAAISTAVLDGDATEEASKDAALFGVEIFALFAARASEIALDPTVDREVFRSQRDRLKAAGYRFVSRTQRWSL